MACGKYEMRLRLCWHFQYLILSLLRVFSHFCLSWAWATISHICKRQLLIEMPSDQQVTKAHDTWLCNKRTKSSRSRRRTACATIKRNCFCMYYLKLCTALLCRRRVYSVHRFSKASWMPQDFRAIVFELDKREIHIWFTELKRPIKSHLKCLNIEYLLAMICPSS